MYCRNCGNNIPDAAKFCGKCGAPVKPRTQNTTSAAQPDSNDLPERKTVKGHKEKTKHTKSKVIVLVLILMVVVIAVGCIGVYFISPAYQVQKLLREDAAGQAVAQYNEDVCGNKLWETLTDYSFHNYCDQLINDAESDDADYADLSEKFTVLSDISNQEISEQALSALQHIQNRETYEDAEALYNSGDYIAALKLYTQISEDSELYTNAQEKAQSCRDKYKEDILSQLEDLMEDKDYAACLDLLDDALEEIVEDVDFSNYKDTIISACLQLVGGCESFNGHSYKVFQASKDQSSFSWSEAKDYCESLGGHLATVTDAKEEEFLESLIQTGDKYFYWLGATDSEQEGLWKWITGETWAYTKWNESEPTNESGINGASENCLAIEHDSMEWNDIQDAGDPSGNCVLANSGFICEWDFTDE